VTESTASAAAQAGVYVNVGCGSVHHPAWRNYDLVSQSPDVIACDLRNGIPVADAGADAVYSSHVLEHLRRHEVPGFLAECRRVLAPSGTLRIVVPDLEGICRTYLDRLEAALAGEPGVEDDYDWIMLELFDQTVREEPGGGMRAYLTSGPVPNVDFVRRRIGSEADSMLAPAAATTGAAPHVRAVRAARRSLHQWRTTTRARLLGPDGPDVARLGRMRMSGEVHQWMYDRYSLARLLEQNGFRSAQATSAVNSAVPGWSSFHLDTDETGAIRKPDSLFMESVRP